MDSINPSRMYPANKRELLFLFCILPIGLLMANAIVAGGFNLGFSIASCLCILCCGIYLLQRGSRPSIYSASLLILSMVISASFARADDALVKFVMLCFLLVSTNLGFCLLAGKNRYAPGGAASVLDAGHALFTMGFGELPASYRGLSHTFRHSGPAGQKGGAVLLGLGIAAPVLLVIIPLLMKADAAFEGLLDLLPEFNITQFIMTIILGVCLVFVLYTRGVALKNYVNQKPVVMASKGLSPLTVNTVLGTVCFVFLVYLASQLAYFIGGFSGLLPEEYTLAEYARRGFFEMAWLCAINLGVIIAALSFCEKRKPAPKSTRLLCLFIGIVTLFLVATASAKMLLYIQSYGLTRLRVLTQVVMVFLALVTVMVSLWLFLPKLPYMKVILLTALIIGAAVSWADVDSQVAKYNVDAYLESRMETVDVAHLGSLGDGAVPQLLRLSQEAPDPQIREMASDTLESKKEFFYTYSDFRGWNYAKQTSTEILLPDQDSQ